METTSPARVYDAACRDCERLAGFLDQVRTQHPTYFCKPVPPFGSHTARLVVVGLAPGKHGANRSGRPFTGDHAGILLYRMLHAHGFASSPVATSIDDGLALIDCRVTNAVKCLPPENKPTPLEMRTCNRFLAADLARLVPGSAILALGRIAHDAVLRARGTRSALAPFSHGGEHALAGELRLFDSYHCSRYNTQTRRLTEAMFDAVFARVVRYLQAGIVAVPPARRAR